jgi:hypothetical protein
MLAVDEHVTFFDKDEHLTCEKAGHRSPWMDHPLAFLQLQLAI